MEQCLSSYIELINSDSNWPLLSSMRETFLDPQVEFSLEDVEEVKEVEIKEIEEVNNFELIKLYLETKEEKVWGEFYLRFNQCLESYVRKALLNYKNTIFVKEMGFFSLQEELVQEVYLKLFSDDCKALREYKDRNNCFYAYLHKIAVHTVVGYFRRLNFQKRQAVTVSLEKADDKLSRDFLGSNVSSCDLILFKCEVEDFLNKVLSTIKNKRNKKIFILFTILGMSSKEIIQVFDSPLTVDAIESVVKNIRKSLKELLLADPLSSD